MVIKLLKISCLLFLIQSPAQATEIKKAPVESKIFNCLEDRTLAGDSYAENWDELRTQLGYELGKMLIKNDRVLFFANEDLHGVEGSNHLEAVISYRKDSDLKPAHLIELGAGELNDLEGFTYEVEITKEHLGNEFQGFDVYSVSMKEVEGDRPGELTMLCLEMGSIVQ